MNRSEHLLTILAEECTEVAKECCKALRFGPEDKVTLDPYGPRGTEGPTNAEKIRTECMQLVAMYEMCVAEGILAPIDFDSNEYWMAEKEKHRKVEAYLRYSEDVGHYQPGPND